VGGDVVGGDVVGGDVVGGDVVGGDVVGGDVVGGGLRVNVGAGEEGDAVGDGVGVGPGTGVGLLAALPPVPLLLPWPGAELAVDGVGLLVVEPVLCGFAPVGRVD
jgi:hypothetical protein